MKSSLMNILPIIATFFMVACYVPQVVQTFKTKDVSSISLPFFGMLNIALTLLLINSVLLFTQNGNFGYVVSYIFNEGLALTMLIMILKYRRNKTK
ncbi:SemiSWEET family sugar transporter [Staphylococcus equorum]|uniref:PQ-loop domain-containing transporter n=1 Tax=Staphylococcus equorum TaxID=246432 RepID=A0A9X4R2R3_9STAP|nr:PQ-loop domain-containing transporter [Staphylococcus equorum]MDG0860396.1 PQ-loop domain-containing transporter [Staphylococcus equorum]